MLNKRWVSAGITVLGAIFLLAGCGEKRGQRTNGLDTEEMAGHDGCIVVGYAQVGSESDWRTTNTQSFKNIFTEENGYYLIFEDWTAETWKIRSRRSATLSYRMWTILF